MWHQTEIITAVQIRFLLISKRAGSSSGSNKIK